MHLIGIFANRSKFEIIKTTYMGYYFNTKQKSCLIWNIRQLFLCCVSFQRVACRAPDQSRLDQDAANLSGGAGLPIDPPAGSRQRSSRLRPRRRSDRPPCRPPGEAPPGNPGENSPLRRPACHRGPWCGGGLPSRSADPETPEAPARPSAPKGLCADTAAPPGA